MVAVGPAADDWTMPLLVRVPPETFITIAWSEERVALEFMDTLKPETETGAPLNVIV